MAKLTVIMPSLNVRDYIYECVSSVVDQSFKDLQILCIDAGSTDGTLDILEEFEKKDNRVTLVRSPKKSYGYQVNLGLAMAAGEYVAVVETDDYLSNNMYEILVDIAGKENLDYVKCDFANYITLSNGQRYFQEIHFLEENNPCCQKVICPKVDLENGYGDWAVWRAVYKTDFLKKNNIVFNESPGAACQDTGFMCQVLKHAKKVIYIRDVLYKRCMDRETASTHDTRLIKYYYDEYRWVKDKIFNNGIEIDIKHYYQRMISAFLGAYLSLMERDDIDLEQGENRKYCEWFRAELQSAIENRYIGEEDINENQWQILQKMMKYSLAFRNELVEKRSAKNLQIASLKNFCKEKEIVIFGCGNLGYKAIEQINKWGYSIGAIADNNSANWKYNANIEIASPDKVVKEYPKAIYFIQNKYHSNDIKNQLVELGISKEQIIENGI